MRKVVFKIIILFSIIFFNTTQSSAKLKVYDAGFSFGSILPKDTITNLLLSDNGGS